MTSLSPAPETVLHVLWALDKGGAPVYQLVREQRRRGIAADILVGSVGGFYAQRAGETGARVHELRQRRGFDARGFRRARAILRSYPIVHFHAREPLLISYAAQESDIRLFYTHRGGNRHYPVRKRVRHGIIGHYLRGRFDGVAANTVQGARAAAHIYRLPLDSIQVIYNGLDFSLIEPKQPKTAVLAELGGPVHDVVRVGTAAILRPLKRVDRLLQALTTMPRGRIHCYVFGDGPARPELERLVAQLALSDQVTFAGHKTSIGDYLQVLDIFTLPSGPEESFGNALVEAMALGVPSVIFADGGGMLEHVKHGVTGLVAKNQQEFELHLRKLATDPGFRRRLGEAGRASVRENYTLEAMVSGHSALYESSHQRNRMTRSEGERHG